MRKISESKAVCPKCKSNHLTLIEEWSRHSIEWQQDGGMFDMANGSLNHGDPTGVYARCDECNHKWKIRKAIQITDIIK